MNLLVSPYHLSAQETPAMAALQLADRVITALPSPDRMSGVQDLKDAVRAAPRYRELLGACEDFTPLLHSGVLASEFEGESPMDEVRRAVEDILVDPRCEALRRFVSFDRFAGDGRAMEALAHDLLRAGPDPAISVPLACGLDAFASRNGLIIVRGAPESIAQRAELKLATDHFRVALPMIVQAEIRVYERARDVLESARLGIGSIFQAAFEADIAEQVREAAEAYTAAFADAIEEITSDVAPEDLQVRIETLSLRGICLPADAVIRSSLIAARSFDRQPSKQTSSALAERRESNLAPTFSLIISPIVRRG